MLSSAWTARAQSTNKSQSILVAVTVPSAPSAFSQHFLPKYHWPLKLFCCAHLRVRQQSATAMQTNMTRLPSEDGSGATVPQRLDKVLATLHSLLVDDDEACSYSFTVDAADDQHILAVGESFTLHDSFPKLARLSELLGRPLHFVS